jgi:hypothetical protein
MKKYIFFGFLFFFCVSNKGVADGQLSKSNNTYMIRHTVVFKLIHVKDSPGEKAFLNAIMKLSAIPGVLNFECLRQISKKNTFDFGLSMEFDSMKAYEDYNQNPDHVAFVQTYWKKKLKILWK